jgi:hypothetical protein
MPVEMRRIVVPAKQLLLKDNFIKTDEAGQRLSGKAGKHQRRHSQDGNC